MVREFPDPSASTWLERVSFSLADGSMSEADAEWLARFTEIGLEPGRTSFTPEQLDAAARGEHLGRAHVAELAPTLTNAGELLGTREELQHGARDLFASGTFLGQWGLPPVESVYIKVDTGSDGLILNGSGGKEYRARFAAPEVSEFWSFTSYAYSNRLMAHNTLNRHSRSDRTLTPDADGLYTILLGATVAGNTGFLPIPEEDTYLVLRLYGPSPAMQRGEYPAPVFEVVEKP